MTTAAPVGVNNAPKLVYKSTFIDDNCSSNCTGSGEVMVWDNGECQIIVNIKEKGEEQFSVFMTYGVPGNYKFIRLGAITTDSKGNANENFNLSEFMPLNVEGIAEFMNPYQPINPGFFIGTATSTGFSIPEPAPKITAQTIIRIQRVEVNAV